MKESQTSLKLESGTKITSILSISPLTGFISLTQDFFIAFVE